MLARYYLARYLPHAFQTQHYTLLRLTPHATHPLCVQPSCLTCLQLLHDQPLCSNTCTHTPSRHTICCYRLWRVCTAATDVCMHGKSLQPLQKRHHASVQNGGAGTDLQHDVYRQGRLVTCMPSWQVAPHTSRHSDQHTVPLLVPTCLLVTLSATAAAAAWVPAVPRDLSST